MGHPVLLLVGKKLETVESEWVRHFSENFINALEKKLSASLRINNAHREILEEKCWIYTSADFRGKRKRKLMLTVWFNVVEKSATYHIYLKSFYKDTVIFM